MMDLRATDEVLLFNPYTLCVLLNDVKHLGLRPLRPTPAGYPALRVTP
jgi:hypothetical protein